MLVNHHQETLHMFDLALSSQRLRTMRMHTLTQCLCDWWSIVVLEVTMKTLSCLNSVVYDLGW